MLVKESKAKFAIDELKCKCNYNFKLDEIEKVVFKENNNVINLNEIIPRLLSKKINNQSNFKDSIIEKDGIPAGLSTSYKNIPLDNITAVINEIEHKSLILSFEYFEPFEYKRII
jgi:hypothetical protein